MPGPAKLVSGGVTGAPSVVIPIRMFEQDDVENWVSITSTAAGSMARRLLLNSRMGMTTDGAPVTPPLTNFAGPGTAYVGYGEYNQRALLRKWADCLEAEPSKPRTVGIGDSPAPGRAK